MWVCGRYVGVRVCDKGGHPYDGVHCMALALLPNSNHSWVVQWEQDGCAHTKVSGMLLVGTSGLQTLHTLD